MLIPAASVAVSAYGMVAALLASGPLALSAFSLLIAAINLTIRARTELI